MEPRGSEGEASATHPLVGVIVHDLKGPLTAIISNAGFLLEQTPQTPEALECLRDVRYAAEHLRRMVMNLGDLSSSETGALAARWDNLDLVSLLDEVGASMRYGAAYRDQRIEVLPALGERRVRGDRELLRRCLQSLIENAMRHGPAGSVIRLGSSTADGRLRLRVSDEGESLPLAQRERVFDSVPPESTSFARKRDAGDIELRFCRVVADAHGGVIAVEDAVPRGVCFCLDLPLRVAFAASERPRVRF